MAVGVRADRHESRGTCVAHRGPCQWSAGLERALLVDERRGEVPRRGDLVAHEDRQRDVDEVGGAVVEGHGDTRTVGLALQCIERVAEADHICGRCERCHLLVEHRGRQIDGRVRARADAVVQQDDDAGGRASNEIRGAGDDLDGRPQAPISRRPHSAAAT